MSPWAFPLPCDVFRACKRPSYIQPTNESSFRDSQSLDNYLDDVLSHTPDWSRHLITLRDFFNRIRRTRITLWPSKCEIDESTVSFLGHTLSEGILSPKQDTVDKILNAPPPRTHKQL